MRGRRTYVATRIWTSVPSNHVTWEGTKVQINVAMHRTVVSHRTLPLRTFWGYEGSCHMGLRVVSCLCWDQRWVLRVAKKRLYCLRWQMQLVVLQLHRCVDLTLSYLIVPIDNLFYHRVRNPENDAKARCELFCVLSVQRRLMLNFSSCQTNISGNWTCISLHPWSILTDTHISSLPAVDFSCCIIHAHLTRYRRASPLTYRCISGIQVRHVAGPMSSPA
jgi:hypothetical protein